MNKPLLKEKHFEHVFSLCAIGPNQEKTNARFMFYEGIKYQNDALNYYNRESNHDPSRKKEFLDFREAKIYTIVELALELDSLRHKMELHKKEYGTEYSLSEWLRKHPLDLRVFNLGDDWDEFNHEMRSRS